MVSQYPVTIDKVASQAKPAARTNVQRADRDDSSKFDSYLETSKGSKKAEASASTSAEATRTTHAKAQKGNQQPAGDTPLIVQENGQPNEQLAQSPDGATAAEETANSAPQASQSVELPLMVSAQLVVEAGIVPAPIEPSGDATSEAASETDKKAATNAEPEAIKSTLPQTDNRDALPQSAGNVASKVQSENSQAKPEQSGSDAARVAAAVTKPAQDPSETLVRSGPVGAKSDQIQPTTNVASADAAAAQSAVDQPKADPADIRPAATSNSSQPPKTVKPSPIATISNDAADEQVLPQSNNVAAPNTQASDQKASQPVQVGEPVEPLKAKSGEPQIETAKATISDPAMTGNDQGNAKADVALKAAITPETVVSNEALPSTDSDQAPTTPDVLPEGVAKASRADLPQQEPVIQQLVQPDSEPVRVDVSNIEPVEQQGKATADPEVTLPNQTASVAQTPEAVTTSKDSIGTTNLAGQNEKAPTPVAASPIPSAPSEQQPSGKDADLPATEDAVITNKSADQAPAESRPALSKAPKGDAFSKMMAQIENQFGLKDQTMLSDPTIKVDNVGQMSGDPASLRLTGMEQMVRTGQMPPQAAAANAQAMAAHIAKFAQKGETRFEIRLDPADLGRVDVRLTIGSDGQTRAHLFVEKSETLDFLMRDQRMLERNLQQSGLNLDKQGVEYSLMDQGEQQQRKANDFNEQFARDQSGDTDEIVEELADIASTEQHYSGNYIASNGVNLVI